MMGKPLTVDTQRLKWFADSPDAGPECICSLCGKPIEEPEIPLRLFDSEKNVEARLHTACWNEVSPDKIHPVDRGEEYDPYIEDPRYPDANWGTGAPGEYHPW